MKIVTRKQAIEGGFKQFFTGKPCKRGHVAFRHTSGGGCSQCKKEGYKNSDYMSKYCKEWRKKNEDYHKNYNAERKDLISDRQKRNREKINKRRRELYAERKNGVVRKWTRKDHD